MSWLTPRPSQQQRDASDLQARYQRITRQWLDVQAIENLTSAIFDVLDYELSDPMRRALHELLVAEQGFGSSPDFARMDFHQQRDFRQKLDRWERRSADGGAIATDFLVPLFIGIAEELPRASQPSLFTIPLICTLERPAELISRIYKTLFTEKYLDRDLFEELRTRMYLNLCHVSGVTPYKEVSRFKHAIDSTLPLDALNDAYLSGTPLHTLFSAPVPLRMTTADRMNHMHVIGNTGSGKSTLLTNLIVNDIRDPERPSVVVIEPTGDLVRKLQRADLGIEDRLIIIDPQDLIAPALNPFSLKAGAGETARERARANIIQTFNFLFSSLAGGTGDLTSKQSILFAHMAEAMLAFPVVRKKNATVLDLFRFLQDPHAFADVVAVLDEFSREFFEEELFPKNSEFTKTRKEVAYRLRGVLHHPAIRRLFNAPETRLDLKHALDNGYVILVDTARDHLADGSPIFGKLFISLILQTILQRAEPGASRHPTYIYIDECSDYFDSSVNEFLNQARKYNCGVILAHRQLEETTSSALKASLLTNPGIRFASRISVADARSVSANMRTTPEFIMGQPRYTWAAYIQDVTKHAVAIPTGPSPLDRIPQLSAARYEALVVKNRAKVALPETPQRSWMKPAEPYPIAAEEGSPYKPHPRARWLNPPDDDEDVSRE